MGRSASRRAANDAAQMRADEEARQRRIERGTGNINRVFDRQFDNNYFSGIADSYMDFARPQLDQQRDEANRQLVFDLARTGKLDSSSRATQGAKLQETYDLGLQSLADDALSQSNQARNAVEDARAALIAQVNATGDATGATQAANRRVAALSQPAGDYSPLADMFAGFTSNLGQRYAQERAFAASGGLSRGYTPITYGPRSGSVSVTG